MTLTVSIPSERLAAVNKPQLREYNRFEIRPSDVLVVCSGFEDRSLAVLERAVESSTGFSVLCVKYEPHLPENKDDAISAVCGMAGVAVRWLTYDRCNPAGFGGNFLDQLTGYTGRIVVDVSAMSRLLIVQIVVALASRDIGFENCFVAYTQAAEYPPTPTEANAKLVSTEADPTLSALFLSSGVFDITVLPELSSLAPAGPQTRLIAFPTFDAHQLTSLRAEIQPSRLIFIEGVPPSSQNSWRTSMISKLNGIDEVQKTDRRRTSTLDYRETVDCLVALYSEYGWRERLLISPTGSKMQALAVGLFRAFVEDVQIVYPTPVNFVQPTAYTHGVGMIHLLPLGDFLLPDHS